MSDQEKEPWLGSGVCTECRRRSYCKTSCTAYKRRYERITKRIMSEAAAKILPLGTLGNAYMDEMVDDGKRN